ncbi:MAG: hypothetical protein HZB21_06915 [Deltaproteobacteria bacterium]|nr:hypothetical protein [Deltaproteobacteria bacterium]MBI5810899.1 hypothetical protein [Deltaproteobacteria bacterium]
MKKSLLWIFPAIILWVFTAGMGKAPGPDVPLPEVDFKATIRDDQDIATKVTHASWDGNTYITGTRGKGAVAIAFEKIRKIAGVGTGTGTQKDFQITLKNGEVVAVSLDDESKFYGTTSFGTYRISAKNIKEIAFE